MDNQIKLLISQSDKKDMDSSDVTSRERRMPAVSVKCLKEDQGKAKKFL